VPVLVSIGIIEGVRTIVGSIRIEGNASVSDTVLRQGLGLRPGDPYLGAQLRTDADAIQLTYANLGYRSATVEPQAGFTPDRAEANPVFVVREGPRIFVDHVLIAGNFRTKTQTIERELRLKPGDPLSLSAVQESQRRLAALQLFRRAPQITELKHGDETTRDLLVTVEESTPTTVEEGAGLEGRLRVVPSAITGAAVEKFEVAPRAFVGYSRRNLFGRNRSINLFGSVSLHPPDISSSSTIGYGLTEYRALVAFHEPRVLNTAVDGLVSAVIEQQIRSSFNFSRKSITAQVAKRLSPAFSVSAAYQLQDTHLFDVNVPPDEQPLIDRAFTTVLLSSVSFSSFYDTRDDPVDPSRGGYLNATGQLAARALGSEVGFVKTSFAAETVRLLPHSRGIVFVGVARLGLATGFPREVNATGPDGNPIVIDQRDLPEAERFFAGGDTTVRGFALDTLGTPETISSQGFPLGGNAMVIFNAELRVPVRGGLGIVGFLDTGNVFAHVVDLDLTELRSAVGFGLRYRSPIGPIRIDWGFKVHPQPGEGPSAWFISFGQAF
jgi:outer membrane protein assembly complex protein YaeT